MIVFDGGPDYVSASVVIAAVTVLLGNLVLAGLHRRGRR